MAAVSYYSPLIHLRYIYRCTSSITESSRSSPLPVLSIVSKYIRIILEFSSFVLDSSKSFEGEKERERERVERKQENSAVILGSRDREWSVGPR